MSVSSADRQDETASGWVGLATALATEFATTAVERERQGILPVAELKQLRETGLVNLLIPREFGGEGGSFPDAVRVIVELAKGDASIAALLGFHYYLTMVPRQFDFAGDAEAIQRKSAENRWLWANVHQPREAEFVATPMGDGGYRINGTKRWATGVTLADVTTVIAQQPGRGELLFALIPTDREGLRFRDDWDNLGLRLAETVTVDFADVAVHPDEVIRATDGAPQLGFPPFYQAFAGAIYGAIYVGSTWAALQRARDYVLERPKARAVSGVEKASQDPLALVVFGELWGKVRVAEALLHRVAAEVHDGFARRLTISARERGELTARALAARAFAAQIGLEVTPQVYDLTGTSASANSWGFDRHWRDIRTLSLHDPLSLSVKTIGDFYLNGVIPPIPYFVAPAPYEGSALGG